LKILLINVIGGVDGTGENLVERMSGAGGKLVDGEGEMAGNSPTIRKSHRDISLLSTGVNKSVN
jgi:hypothetical protein